MRLRGQSFARELEPFRFNGIEFGVEEHQRNEKIGREEKRVRRNIYIVGPGERKNIKKDPYSRDVTRLSYTENEMGLVRFIGMSVAKSQRGKGMAGHMFDYFREMLDRRDAMLVVTDRINKPVIGLVLQRAGLVPEHNGFRVQILPDVSGSNSDVPNVVFLDKNGPSWAVVPKSSHGEFYHEIPLGLAHDFTSAPDHEKIVAIHTRYHSPSLEPQAI